ncbi:MAG: L,D-transpeptidase family protein [Lachnospiraceae bacterium]|nr:L,D-transpeptidase family protein [Lachnospiraceae bacterium]
MRKSMKKYLAAVVAMSALLQLTAYAGPGFSASASREAAAAANTQYEAMYGAQVTVPLTPGPTVPAQSANADAQMAAQQAAQAAAAQQAAAQQAAAQQAAAQKAAQQKAQAAAKAQNSKGSGGASIDMNAINQNTVSPAEAMVIGQKLATVNGMSVTYQMPNKQTEVLDGLTIASWVNGSKGLTVSVDAAKVADYVQGLRNKYDTPTGTQTWQSADGTTKSIKTNYGWHIDQTKETEALIANIQSLQSVTREPVYSSRAAQTAMPQWGKTFVEIDISSQHVYFYQDGNCVWDSKCVTGTATDPDRATPTGVFALKYKQRDRVLRGRINPQTGKPSYESPVAYWMPFNGNIGLHDANWRSSFGGNIYLKSGSHGCINLPPKNAKTLYELITPGTVIVVCD